MPKSKYDEDVFIKIHTSVCSSWWKYHQWGFKCCKQIILNNYCTGLAGIEAVEAATVLMKANLTCKETVEGLWSCCSCNRSPQISQILGPSSCFSVVLKS